MCGNIKGFENGDDLELDNRICVAVHKYKITILTIFPKIELHVLVVEKLLVKFTSSTFDWTHFVVGSCCVVEWYKSPPC